METDCQSRIRLLTVGQLIEIVLFHACPILVGSFTLSWRKNPLLYAFINSSIFLYNTIYVFISPITNVLSSPRSHRWIENLNIDENEKNQRVDSQIRDWSSLGFRGFCPPIVSYITTWNVTNMISKFFFNIPSLKIPTCFVTHHGNIWSHSVPVNPEGQTHEKKPLIIRQVASFLQGLEAQSTEK